MKVYYDGILIPEERMTDSMRKPKFTIRRKGNDGEKAISFTGDLIFTGVEYNYIYAKLVTDINAVLNTVELKFIDDCCGNKEYVFLIKPENIRWCDGECSITANATEYSENSKQYDCLKNTLIWDNWNNFQAGPHPKMVYCVEYRPAILQDVILCFGVLISLILVLLYPVVFIVGIIVAVINAIITAINTIPGISIDLIDFDGDSSTSTLEEYTAFRDRVQQFLVGCGRKHPSPLVRSYIKNVCDKCGIGFVSSIFNNPASLYYNTVYFNAPVTKGNDPIDTSNWIDKNKPLLNGTKYLDEVKQAINGDWKIIGGVLYLERKDFFKSGTVWIDLTTYPAEKIISICYTWSRKERFAYANLQWSKDPIDWVGNEALDRWNDIVEWNSPPNPTQKGEYLKLLPYGAARFRDDNIERDVLSDYEGAPFLGATIAAYKKAMIMNNGTAFLPKLLIWDGVSYDNSKVRTNYAAATGVAPSESYNNPWWIDASHLQNAYDNFWYIDNPRVSTFVGFDVEAEILFTCDVINDANIDELFHIASGNATTETIEINYENGSIKITGEI